MVVTGVLVVVGVVVVVSLLSNDGASLRNAIVNRTKGWARCECSWRSTVSKRGLWWWWRQQQCWRVFCINRILEVGEGRREKGEGRKDERESAPSIISPTSAGNVYVHPHFIAISIAVPMRV